MFKTIKSKLLITLVVICFSIFTFSSCVTKSLNSIFYETNGGIAISGSLYDAGDVITLPNPSKQGYTFSGWYLDKNLSTKVNSVTMGNEDITVYAAWVENKLTVIYHSLTSELDSSQEIKYTDTSHNLNSPSYLNNGYNMTFWTPKGSTDIYYRGNEDVSSLILTPNSVLELNPFWEQINYNITFQTNSSFVIENLTYNIGSLIYVPSSYKEGYTFVHWELISSSGNWKENQIIAGGEELFEYYGNVTLSAVYDCDEFSITIIGFDSVVSSDITYYSNSDAFIPSITRDGYNLINYEVTFGTGTWHIGQRVNAGDNLFSKYGDATLSANWEIINYTLTINTNTFLGEILISYNASSSDRLPLLEKIGYYFDGYLPREVSGNWEIDWLYVYGYNLYNNYGNVYLEALWTPISYKIDYLELNGTLIEDAIYEITDIIVLPSLTRIGYNFIGWKVIESTGNWRINDIFVPLTQVSGNYGDVNLEAVWDSINYNISFDSDGADYIDTLSFTVESDAIISAPSKLGYNFLYWEVLSSNGNIEILEHLYSPYFLYGTYGDISLKAIYEIIDYTINYYLGSELLTSNTYTIEDSFYLEDITIPHYNFLYWESLENSGSWLNNAIYSTTQLISGYTGSVNLYLRNEPISYNIIFDTDSLDNVSGLAYTIEDYFYLPQTSKIGYLFLGWSPKNNNEFWSESIYSTNNLLSHAYGSVELIAVYELIEYYYLISDDTGFIIFFDTYTIEDTITLIEDSIIGYNFIEYTVTFSSGSLVYGNSYMAYETLSNIWGNFELSAVYQIKSYYLTFDESNGEDMIDGIYEYNSVLPIPSKVGYNFIGWSTSIGDENKFFILPDIGNNPSYEIYANYEKKHYNLTINYNNETEYTALIQVNYNDALPVLNNFLYLGYEFIGYNTDNLSNYGYLLCEDYGSNGDYQIYAIWSIINYTITYNYNGGIVSGNVPTTYTVLDEFMLPNITKNGYHLENGWFVSNIGSTNTIYSHTTGNLVVTANWIINTYTITYYFLGDEIHQSISVLNFNDELPFKNKEGYTFLGWATSAGNPSYSVLDYGNSNSSVILYATFSDKTFYINYYVDDTLTDLSAGTLYYGSTLPNITKLGYIFLGWNTFGNDQSGCFIVVPDLGADESTHDLYAIFEIITYEITYTNLLGTITTNPTSYNVTSNITLSIPSLLTGYDFSNWSINNNIVTTINAGSTGDINIKASWSAKYYLLNFNTFSGSAVNQNTFTYHDNIPLTSKTGYNFLGWCLDSSLTGTSYLVVEQFSVSSGTLIELYAKYEIKTFNINFELNGGSSGSLPSGLSYGSNLPVPSKIGHDFLGWYTNPSFNGYSVLNVPDFGNDTATYMLYAAWETKLIIITFDTMGGDNLAVSTTSIRYGSAIGTLPSPVKEGYSFLNWYYYIGMTKTPIQSGSIVSNSSNFTIYASWNPNNYAVAYNSNVPSSASVAVSGTMELNVYNYGVQFNLLPNKFVLSGYRFLGWSLTQNGPVKYSNTEEVSSLTSQELIFNLYAKWEASSYTITFMVSSQVLTTKTVTMDQSYGALPGYDNGGYHLNNWVISGNTVITSSSKFNTPNFLTATAQLLANTYYVNFNTQGGVILNKASINYLQSFSTILSNPTKLNHIFNNWTLNGTSTVVNDSTICSNFGLNGSEITLNANFSIVYTIVYDSNEPNTSSGSVSGATSESVHTAGISSKLTKNGYSLVGYNFLGWSLTNKGAKVFNDNDTILNIAGYQNFVVIIYAKWEVRSFSVTYVNYSGTSNTVINVTYDSFYNLAALTNPTARNYYTFSGWYTSENGDELVVNALNRWTSLTNLTIYAHWIPFSITIKYAPTLLLNSGYNLSYYGTIDNMTFNYESSPYTINKYMFASAIKVEPKVVYDVSGRTRGFNLTGGGLNNFGTFKANVKEEDMYTVIKPNEFIRDFNGLSNSKVTIELKAVYYVIELTSINYYGYHKNDNTNADVDMLKKQIVYANKSIALQYI
ncbi:MAG: InlB B-repeat-containing protein [Acholeplasmatales bacterium]|jgi:uncharacterized repeat protein (TIGR02543 family)|nr:InlB B-repeat-containing protein [Acholeplasmatales bacterium]